MIRAPAFSAGQRIGLFGGSFNPPHRGHAQVAHFALKALQLDFVWWLIAPQNPLKNPALSARYEERLAATAKIADHPRFRVSDLEAQAQSHTTIDTLKALKPILARGRFVWIMGADSFRDLHRWHDWVDIMETLPLAILARPGYSVAALNSHAALRFPGARVPLEQAANLPNLKPPAWAFIPMPLRPESSSAIRALNGRL